MATYAYLHLETVRNCDLESWITVAVCLIRSLYILITKHYQNRATIWYIYLIPGFIYKEVFFVFCFVIRHRNHFPGRHLCHGIKLLAPNFAFLLLTGFERSTLCLPGWYQRRLNQHVKDICTAIFMEILLKVSEKWFINWWMNKENGVHTLECYLAIKEWHPLFVDNVDGTGGHCIAWEKPGTSVPCVLTHIWTLMKVISPMLTVNGNDQRFMAVISLHDSICFSSNSSRH